MIIIDKTFREFCYWGTPKKTAQRNDKREKGLYMRIAVCDL